MNGTNGSVTMTRTKKTFCILHSAFCIALAAPAAASAETALYFNGNTYIDTYTRFPLANSVTLSARVRVSSAITNNPPYSHSGSYYGAGIVGQGYWGGATGFGLCVPGACNTADTSDDKVHFQVLKSSKGVTGSFTDPALYAGEPWHHYLVVRDKEGGSVHFYVDGRLVVTGAFPSDNNISATQNFAFGKNMANVGGNFRGWIADVALWNEALDADDAARLAVSSPDTIGKAPYAYWPLDEGTGATKVKNKISGKEYPATAGALAWEDDPALHRTSLATSIGHTNGVWYATAELLQGSGVVDLLVVSPQGATNVVALSNGVATAPATFTAAIPGLAADTVYSLAARATDGGVVVVADGGTLFTGPVTVAATADATPTSPGVFTVSRPVADGTTNAPLKVAYTLSGTAVAGTHYAALPGTVTIPAGEASATVNVATIVKEGTTTSLTLSLDGGNHLPGNPASATMSVTTVRTPAALVWSAGTSATELTDPANWTPLVPAIEENDTLSFTGDGMSAYRFTMTNGIAVKSFAFANGTSPAVVDLGGHTLSNYMGDTSGAFRQTGTGPFVLLDGAIRARAFSFQTATFAATNAALRGSAAYSNGTSLTFARDGARYLFDGVSLSLTAYDNTLNFKGWDYVIDARNLTHLQDALYFPQHAFQGTNATIRLHGADTLLHAGISLNGRNIKFSITDGRFIHLYMNSSGGILSIAGEGNEVVITNSTAGWCSSRRPYLDNATRCALRILKGGKLEFQRMDGTHSFEGCTNLVEVADGSMSLPVLRFGYLGAAYGLGGNELAVRGDGATITMSYALEGACLVGNNDKAPVTLSFTPGPSGFGGNAPIRQEVSGRTIRVATNTVFKVDARALTATLDNGRFALPLIRFKSTAEAEAAFDAAALAAFNARLVSRPRGGTLSLETSGSYRVLTWNFEKSSGTVLMLR